MAHGYRDLLTGAEHLALVSGDLTAPDAVVRLHSECLTGDVLGSLRCDCGAQLDAALEQVARRGGAVVYLRGHEGRGVGLLAKLAAYALQDLGRDTVDANLELGLPADAREYGAAAAILHDLGVSEVRLLTNNPAKVEGLAAHGVAVVGRTPLRAGESVFNARYLATKRDRMGHDLARPRLAQRTAAEAGMSGAGSPRIAVDPVGASGLRVAVVAAQWHEQVMDGLVDGALRALAEAGVAEPLVVRVPGSFELPVAAARLARAGLRRGGGARRRGARRHAALRLRVPGGDVRAHRRRRVDRRPGRFRGADLRRRRAGARPRRPARLTRGQGARGGHGRGGHGAHPADTGRARARCRALTP